jgi:hypothetical protein
MFVWKAGGQFQSTNIFVSSHAFFFHFFFRGGCAAHLGFPGTAEKALNWQQSIELQMPMLLHPLHYFMKAAGTQLLALLVTG